MKKKYMAPEAKEVRVEANQAIAACDKGGGGYRIKYLGVVCRSDGCSESIIYDDEETLMANDPNHFNEYYSAPIDWAYKVLKPDNSFYCYLEDYNRNGQFDGGSEGNWQDVHGDYPSFAPGTFNS